MATALAEPRAAMSACKHAGTRDFDPHFQEARMWKFVVGGAFLAFAASGPLQHVGALPQTAVGDLSKQAIKTVLGLAAKDAYGKCGGGGGFKHKNNNGIGNGPELGPAPGNSGNSNSPHASDFRNNNGR
jgi:hypothetical protein